MSSAVARDALYQMWKDAWDATDGWAVLPGVSEEPPVFYQNISPDDAPETSAVKVEIRVLHTEKPMMSFGEGRPKYTARGYVLVRLFVPRDKSGLILADALVNIVKRAFQAKRGTGAADSLVLRGVTPNEEGVRDRWFVVDTVTPFDYEDEVI
jgi:hypothetical protein